MNSTENTEAAERWKALREEQERTGRFLLADCSAEWRGDTFTVFLSATREVIAEDDRIRWSEGKNLEYLAWAWELLNPRSPFCPRAEKWKTISVLRTVRQAIREHFAQGMPITMPEPGCSKYRLKVFLSEARALDRIHHGSVTF